jgi:alpha-L-fucosidase
VNSSGASRRTYLKSITTATIAAGFGCKQPAATATPSAGPPPGHERRIQWWRDAKFGMFIHWGLFSILARDCWAMGDEDIPLQEYEPLSRQFQPPLNAARSWARLARASGMKYMVMTTKHHEGFCLFDSKLTTYCAPQQGPGRDLAREYVDAARAEGLRVGFYYSLMDWHHPDWLHAKDDADARRRFLDYTHGQIRELLTNYGKIDILWYDMPVPLDAPGWQSEEMNRMVFELQPDILVNNRNLLPGDFSTPEETTQAAKGDWESCMTMNDSWGYTASDETWKSPQRIVRDLVECARDGGNYLLNIGPKPDGSVPEPSVRILKAVGNWMQKNGAAIYGTQRCRFPHGNIEAFTRKGNTLYVHVHFWPGEIVTVGGVTTKVNSAKLVATGQQVAFTQRGRQLIFSGLPAHPPDDLVTVIAAECESEPVQDALSSRVDPAGLEATTKTFIGKHPTMES